MERFFIPVDKVRFIKWLFHTSKKNGWTIVLEYSVDDESEYMKSIASEVSLPFSCRHEYNSDCKFIVLNYSSLTDNSIYKIISMTHVLSVHDDEGLVFLIADDFHEECFSGTTYFADKYSKELIAKNLVSYIVDGAT
jgi:hypothetical protein